MTNTPARMTKRERAKIENRDAEETICDIHNAQRAFVDRRALLRELSAVEAERDSLARRECALSNHNCETDGCAIPDGYSKEAEAYADKFHAMKSALSTARARVEQLEGELRNIVNAKRFDLEKFDDDTSFADWAQSRARHTLSTTQEPRHE